MHMLRSAFAAAALALAVSAPAQTAVQIHDIMTNLPNSPYLGQSVSVTGVVVGVMTAGGIYITAQDANWDSNQATAEGMPIFYPTGGYPTCAVVGNVVTLVGTVVNGTAENGADTPGTGLNPTSCTVTGTDVVTRNVALPTGLSSFGQLLPYTGMPFSNTTLFAVAPTGGTLDIPTETVTSNGQFWATFVQSANFHTFRSAGIAEDEFVPAGAPSGITRWSGNPQRIFVDTTTFGGAPVDIGSGQTLTCTVPPGISAGSTSGVGVVDYSLGYLRLLVFPTTQCAVSGSISPAVAAPADAQHFHVGSLNLNRFYNTLGNAFGAVPLTPTAYARQLAKVSIAINTELGQPDIVCLQDVQDLATLTDIANAVNTAASTQYVPYLDMGNDTTTSLNLGFLVKTNTIVVDSVVQYGLNDTYTTASNGTALLWNEPPLVLNAEVKRAGENYQVSVINQEILSRGLEDIDDPVLGPDIRARRGAQAVAASSSNEARSQSWASTAES